MAVRRRPVEWQCCRNRAAFHEGKGNDMKVASGNVLWRQRKRNWCRTPFTFTVYMLTDQEMSIKTGILKREIQSHQTIPHRGY